MKKAKSRPTEDKPRGPVSLDVLERKLDLPDDDINPAAREQASLFLEAAKLRVATMEASSQAKQNLDLTRAKVSLRLRAEAEENNTKLTEGAIATALTADPEVIAAHRKLTSAESAEELTKLLVESYRHRRDSLRILADMHNAEIGVLRSARAKQEDMTDLRAQWKRNRDARD